MIKRDILPVLEEHLAKPEISLIVGPRQAGKTTVMQLLEQKVAGEGIPTVFLNMDRESDKQFFASQQRLVEKLRLTFGDKRGIAFLDEIQRKENAGLFFKGIYDMGLPYKFVLSGSGSVELKENIHESMAGRKRLFELTTLTWREFVNWRTDYRYANKLADFFRLEAEQVEVLVGEYLNFGGYPRVVLAESLAEKQQIIDEIWRSYLERDIFRLLGVQKEEAFASLARLLAGQVGSLVNFAELSNTLDVSAATLKRYVWYMQKTFVLHKVTPFFQNARKELTKAPVFYFTDLGLRNYATEAFGQADREQAAGWCFENLVYLVLHDWQQLTDRINYWRTKSGAEVDFVVTRDGKPVPIEVKDSGLTKPKISRSLHSFINNYAPKHAYVVNRTLTETVRGEKTEVHFVTVPQLDLLW